jgi:hypothetical protein
MLTQERLKELLTYDPATGVFRNRIDRGHVKAGAVAGNTHSTKRYRYISIDSRRYFAHRLAWLYMTGEWPKDQIDHINCIRDDNSWSNLREATNSQNHANIGKRRDNKTGYKGVFRRKDTGKYSARIRINGVQVHLGHFGTAEEAAAIYAEAANVAFDDFARAS